MRNSHRWAVVDVETTGFVPQSHRVLSVAALALDDRGEPERTVVSLVDPGCDPGPVHVHGLTRRKLAGSPTFDALLPELHAVLDGRVLVAHNAAFDHGFLAAEFARTGAALPTHARLCTVALSRRLGLAVPDHKLGTLARHWRVPQRRAHDALDDALVLSRIFGHSLALAGELGLPLPVLDVRGRAVPAARPERVVRVPCAWVNPGRLQLGGRLVRGMAVVITGPTSMPRGRLAARMQEVGLDVGNSVSGRTSVLVSNDEFSMTRKKQHAQAKSIPVISERVVLDLMQRVDPGSRKTAEPISRSRCNVALTTSATSVDGPWSSRRILVIGGRHEDAVVTRREVGALGGAVALNLTAAVTDVLVLDGGESDPRCATARARGLRMLCLADLRNPVSVPGEVTVPSLPRGAAVDLPGNTDAWTVNASWRATDAGSDEVDVVTLLLGLDEQVGSDEDFVFYNQPAHETGAVALSVDGSSEQSVHIDLRMLPDECSRVRVGAAVADGRRFGEVGAIALSIDNDAGPFAAAVLDAATTEQTLILAEFYRRNGSWRLRIVGQGYDDGLAGLAQRHGVTVD